MPGPYGERAGPPSVVLRAGAGQCHVFLARPDVTGQSTNTLRGSTHEDPQRRRTVSRYMSTLHVEPHNGSWVVRRDDAATPLSEHADAGAATRAARARAHSPEIARVLVHDRYHRTFTIADRRFTRP